MNNRTELSLSMYSSFVCLDMNHEEQGCRITYCMPFQCWTLDLSSMWDFELNFLWSKVLNLILELEPDDPIGHFNNVFWTSANDSISLSKKLTCWVLKGPTGQSSPGKATESRGVGVGVGGIIIYCFRFNMNHVIHPIETTPRLLAGEGGGVLSQGSKPSIELRFKVQHWNGIQ